MPLVNLLRSRPGHVLRIAVGFALIVYGATHVSLVGLVLMMVGMVPAVTGLAGVCRVGEVAKRRGGSHV